MGAQRSGRSDPDIVTLFTLRFTKVSEMTFPWTVISPVMSAEPETVSVVDGDDVPIPTFVPLSNMSEFAMEEPFHLVT